MTEFQAPKVTTYPALEAIDEIVSGFCLKRKRLPKYLILSTRYYAEIERYCRVYKQIGKRESLREYNGMRVCIIASTRDEEFIDVA